MKKKTEQRPTRAYSIYLLLIILPFFWFQSQAGSSAPPPGFSLSTYVSGLNIPVDLEIMPDGGFLVAEKGYGSGTNGTANIRLVRDGILQIVPVVAISTNPFSDSGIQGLVLDPDFGSNRYFYVWYATDEGSLGWNGTSVNRLSRFTFDPISATADPASELIVLDGVVWSEGHNGGGLAFGQDGYLYIATGDAFLYEPAQDLESLNGKILRINPTENGYTIPPSNPYINNPNALNEIYAIGLRNPFRMEARTSDGAIFVADVGQNTWEELNQVSKKANYGWPSREGPCPTGQKLPCPTAPPQFTDPILYYQHPNPTVGGAITGLALYEGTRFPDLYHNRLFFADINLQFIKTARLASLPVTENEFGDFVDEVGFIVDAEYHDDELFFVEINEGKIIQLSYSGSDNEVPFAVIAANTHLGAAPLTVHFSGIESTIPTGATPTYHWDFGDGSSPLSTSVPVISHAYSSDGNYFATLWIEDGNGGVSNTDSVMITVYSGELAQINLTNLTEPGRVLYNGGDIWEHAANRSTMADLDPLTPYSWRIDLHHHQHFHPVVFGSVTISDTFEIPSDDHGGAYNLWYRFYLTMKTNSGIEVTTYTEIFPELVDLIMTTSVYDPGNTTVVLNNVEYAVPHAFTSIVGTEYQATAPELIFFEHGLYHFDQWEGGDPGETLFEFTAPDSETTLTANYLYGGPANTLWIPFIALESDLGGTRSISKPPPILQR